MGVSLFFNLFWIKSQTHFQWLCILQIITLWYKQAILNLNQSSQVSLISLLIITTLNVPFIKDTLCNQQISLFCGARHFICSVEGRQKTLTFTSKLQQNDKTILYRSCQFLYLYPSLYDLSFYLCHLSMFLLKHKTEWFWSLSAGIPLYITCILKGFEYFQLGSLRKAVYHLFSCLC